ncbi:MFS transporter [Shewanella violacea]|uniref:Transmembrane efflux protein n=2 Tax=Shewanella violacea TaxID=60217 RepID=D4ZJJ5_SHEVD|nr:transmembrane efflux protein [Shewanella violacea DSS12]
MGFTKAEAKILLCVCLAQFAVSADNITTALLIKDIMMSFQVSIAQGQIVTSSYSVISAPLMIVTGLLGYFFCWKKIFQFGLFLCTAGEFSALFIHDFYPFIGISRLAFGIGAALTLASSVALLTTRIQVKNRMIAFSIWGASVAIISMISPMLLALITSTDWRRSFLFLGFISLTALILSRNLKNITPDRTEKKIDLVAVSLIVSIVGLFLVSVSLAPSLGFLSTAENHSVLDNLTIPTMMLITAIILSFVFFAHDRMKSKLNRNDLYITIIPKSFVNKEMIAGLYILLFLYLIYGGVLFSIVSYISLGTYDIFDSSIAITVFALPMFFVSVLIASKGKDLTISSLNTIGLLILTVSLAMLAWSITRTESIMPIYLGMTSIGIGCGFIASKSNIAVNNSVDASLSEQSSGLQVSARNIGYVIGIALFTSGLTLMTKGQLLDSAFIGSGLSDVAANVKSEFYLALSFMSNNSLHQMMTDFNIPVPTNIDTLNNNARSMALQNALYISSIMCLLSIKAGRMVENKPK